MTIVQNYRLTTGRLYWLPRGATTGYIDFGNVTAYKSDPKPERLPHFASSRGKKTLDLQLLKSIKNLWSFTLDEHFAATIALLAIGTQLADTVQAAAAGVAVVIAAADLQEGRVYDFSKQSVSGVVVTLADLTPVPAAAYELDSGGGYLRINPDADLSQDWHLTFDCAAVTKLNFDTFSSLLAQGAFRFIEQDQFDEVPVNTQDFQGQVYVTSWGDATGDKFNEFTIEVLFTTLNL